MAQSTEYITSYEGTSWLWV